MEGSDRPRAVDLFAGAGLLSYAFAREGFEISLAIESDRRAVETYRRNLGDHIVHGDIARIAPQGRCDVLIGGPPCQGFSTLGKRRMEDPRNGLAAHFVKWARELNPKIVVVENVEPFAMTDQGERLARQFRKLGYEVQVEVLDAATYGAAQRRRRSFTVGTKMGNVSISPLPHFGDATVRDAWRGLSRCPDGENSHYSPEPSLIARERMKLIPPGGGKADLMRVAPEICPPSWWRSRIELTDVWGRLRWDRPSNTIRTCFNKRVKRQVHPPRSRSRDFAAGGGQTSIDSG